MIWVYSCSCQSSHEKLDTGEEEPGFGACDSGFEVFGQASIAIEPSQRAFDHPAARHDFEALCGVGSLDDFERPAAEALERLGQLGPGVSAVGEDMAQPGAGGPDRAEHGRGAVAVLNIGGMHDRGDQQAARVGQDVALAAFHLLAGIIAARAAIARG